MRNKSAIGFLLRHPDSFVSPLAAVGAGFAAALAVLVFIAPDPLAAVTRFFTGPFSSAFYLGSWLNTASLLCFSALGAVFALKSGSLNLGGEGQIYLAGFITAVVLNGLKDSYPPLAVFGAFFAALFCTGLVALFSGLLKARRGTSEVLTTFLASAAIIPLVNYAIAGAFRDKAKNLLATPMIPAGTRLSSVLPPSALNISFFIALVLCIMSFWFFTKTRRGYKYRLCGAASEFAFFSGFAPKKVTMLGMFFSGLLHAMTGFFAVTGTYFTCYSGFYAGLGWNALTAALIARANPFAVLPASLVMAFLLTASSSSAVTNVLTFDVCDIISAVVLLCISAQFVRARVGFAAAGEGEK